MLKKFKPLLSHILLSACAFSVICRASICLTIFLDNVPPDDLEQWISNKRKRHDWYSPTQNGCFRKWLALLSLRACHGSGNCKCTAFLYLLDCFPEPAYRLSDLLYNFSANEKIWRRLSFQRFSSLFYHLHPFSAGNSGTVTVYPPGNTSLLFIFLIAPVPSIAEDFTTEELRIRKYKLLHIIWIMEVFIIFLAFIKQKHLLHLFMITLLFTSSIMVAGKIHIFYYRKIITKEKTDD